MERSSYTQILTVPRHNLSFYSRAFRISAPKNWNTLPLEVRQSHSLPTFRNRALGVSRVMRYINLRYLLTYLETV